MTWLYRKADHPIPHSCVLPEVEDADYGDIWQCDDCLKRWKVAHLDDCMGGSKGWRRRYWPGPPAEACGDDRAPRELPASPELGK